MPGRAKRLKIGKENTPIAGGAGNGQKQANGSKPRSTKPPQPKRDGGNTGGAQAPKRTGGGHQPHPRPRAASRTTSRDTAPGHARR